MAWHGKVRPGLLLLLFSFVVISEALAKSLEMYRYDTAYACEGKTLKIECKEGELIKLIRANYGRFSITICNDHGNTDWSVNCMSPKSLRVLHGRCDGERNCTVAVNNETFDDPCPGTLKYIEAHYRCTNEATTTTTTNRPSPPWLITSQPPVWSTVKPSARPPPPAPKITVPPPPRFDQTVSSSSTTTSSPNLPVFHVDDEERPEPEQVPDEEPNKNFHEPIKPIPDEITTLPFTTVTPKKTTSETTYPNTFVPQQSSVLPSWTKDAELANHCAPTVVRSINWVWTKVNATCVQPCPGGTTGFAKWRCIDVNSVPTWYPATPDLSQCRSVWLTSLEQRILAGRDPLVSITNDLAQVTSSKTLYGGDMMITTKMIKNMAEKTSQDIQTFPDARQREAIVTEMLNDVVKTGSNLLDSAQHPSWRDLSYKEQMRVATSLLIGLEENAFLLADTVSREKTVDQVVKNIMLSVRVLETKSVTTEVFPSDNKWAASNDSIELSQGALQVNSDNGLVRLVFVAFDRLEEILQWQPDSSEPNNKNVTRILNSKVISASLGKGRHIQLDEPVRLTLRHLQTENVSNPSCVFWDYTTNAWLEEGCQVETSNHSHTVCLCNHLTNFAILMDVDGVNLQIPHQIALKIITYVGCIISIICLVFAIITFQFFRGLKSDRTTIHCNLCICLLIAELIFLIGIAQTDNKIVCGVIAGFLQYFFLCAFIWMFFEGFQLYVMLVEVFEAEKSRVKWYYFFAYGLPLLIVLISAAIYPQGYGTEQHCWLKTNNYFIYSFVGPVLLVLVLNLIFLGMAVIKMCNHASASVSLKNKEHSRLASTSGKEENALQTKFQAHLAWLKGAAVLVFLLGLTWSFGFFYLNQETVVMAYLFTIFNSLQGFFIFLFHCVQNEKVRKEYRKFIRRHSWLPKCLRCSKPGGGTGSSSGSTGINKERRTSTYAGSNGNPTGPNSHSTDNSVLSPHGTSLQREWNSRSCSNMTRIGRIPVPTSTSGTTAATLCRPTRDGTHTPPPVLEPPNTSTLPYIRNFYKNSTITPNLPKSASTWGPLHKPLHWKNISFKSYSRDSGHGGSEQEDSPRSHTIVADTRLNNAKDVRRQAYVSSDCNQAIMENNVPFNYPDYNRRHDTIPHPKHLPLPQSLQPHGTRKKNGNFAKTNNHWNHHTYTEIYDGRSPRGLAPEDDPVYEEIERNEIQVSDMSDEDGKRQSDMSRQSSRSYGDHRPLIPYSPGTDRSILEAVKKEHNRYQPQDIDGYRMRPNMYRGDAVRSLAAVLDGETVVCHLEPPEMYQRDPYTSRTLVLPPYSES